jgi:hypothetical protein
MELFFKWVGIAVCVCIGGCVIIVGTTSLAINNTVKSPQFQESVKEINSAVEKIEQPPKYVLLHFNQIREGMTYAQIKDILKEDGKTLSSNNIAGYQIIMMSWENENPFDGNMNITFQNGYVISKAQFGLK